MRKLNNLLKGEAQVTSTNTSVHFTHSDWLTWRWLEKYYSPPSSQRETKWLPVSLRFPKKKLFAKRGRCTKKKKIKRQQNLVNIFIGDLFIFPNT